jgi:sulfur carrier protein
MFVQLNAQQREISPGTSLAELIQQLELNPKFLAVEINGELCPRDEHASTVLSEGDQLEIVTLVGGG